MTLGAESQPVTAAVVFPGQGAQAPGLGLVWRDHPAWSVVERAETAAGVDLGSLLLEAPAEALTRTREAQLVVLLASLMAWEASRDEIANRLGGPITAFAGHSLGQITALIATGAIAFDDGIRLAVRRADATQACADAGDHSMAALLGATPEQATEACAAAPDACWVANDNGGGQVVIAGTRSGVEAAGARAKEIGVKRVMALNVGGAFHTPLMTDAAEALRPTLDAVEFAASHQPVVCNTDGTAVAQGSQWPDRLYRHLVQPVRWGAVLATLVASGVTAIVEVGPGSTLTGLAKRQAPDVSLRNISTPEQLAALAREEVRQ